MSLQVPSDHTATRRKSIGDDDDAPTLRPETLLLLHQFLSEAHLKTDDSSEADISEDWSLSQFWYNDETASLMATEAVQESGGGPMAFLSTPSIFRKLKKHRAQIQPGDKEYVEHFLFEYDKRFARYGDQFVHYDYNEPNKIPEKFHHYFSIIFADPPYLSEECFTKVKETIALLAKPNAKIVFLTGRKMEDTLGKLYSDMRACKFAPHHDKGRLQNEFFCSCNYESASLGTDYMLKPASSSSAST